VQEAERLSDFAEHLLGVARPIIQAPMAGVQDSALAIAVSKADALGSLCAMLSPEAMREQLSLLAAHGRAFNVNFFCHAPPRPDAGREAAWRDALAPYFAELDLDQNNIPSSPGRRPFSHDAADVLEEFRPPIVSFHFGLPSADLLERVRGWGAKVISSATTVDEARWLESRGVDAIIAQGLEAGGHRGNFLSGNLESQAGTFALLPQVVRAVRVPVIAAGGIADAMGVRAALQLGAVAAQVGTSYLLCTEARTSVVHRAALQAASSPDTALTNLFSGRPARGIVNRLMRELGPLSNLPPEFPLAAAALAPLRAKAEALGRGDFSPLWAGQNTTGCSNTSATLMTDDLLADL
jgi:nitronate monooxygenase